MADDLQALLRDAESLVEERDWDAALDKYKKILELDAENADACQQMAHIFAIRGMVKSVVKMYFRLMDILEARGDMELAIEVAGWIQRLQPESDTSRMRVIQIHRKKGDLEEVVRQSRELARLYIELGQGDQSIALLQNAQEADPENLDIGLELAEMYVSYGHIEDGAAQYRKVANAFQERGNVEKASEAYRRMKVIVPDDPGVLFTLGRLYVGLGKYNEAEQEFRSILRHNLNHEEALLALGDVCQKKGQFRDAILAFNKILSINPQENTAKEKLGELYQAQGISADAVKHYLSAANAWQGLEENDKAVKLYQRVLALDPTNPTACRELTNLGAPLTPDAGDIAMPAPPAPPPAPETGRGRKAAAAEEEDEDDSIKVGKRRKGLERPDAGAGDGSPRKGLVRREEGGTPGLAPKMAGKPGLGAPAGGDKPMLGRGGSGPRPGLMKPGLAAAGGGDKPMLLPKRLRREEVEEVEEEVAEAPVPEPEPVVEEPEYAEPEPEYVEPEPEYVPEPEPEPEYAEEAPEPEPEYAEEAPEPEPEYVEEAPEPEPEYAEEPEPVYEEAVAYEEAPGEEPEPVYEEAVEEEAPPPPRAPMIEALSLIAAEPGSLQAPPPILFLSNSGLLPYIREQIVEPPDPGVLPWNPLPVFDEEKVRQQRESKVQKAQAAKAEVEEKKTGPIKSAFGGGGGLSFTGGSILQGAKASGGRGRKGAPAAKEEEAAPAARAGSAPAAKPVSAAGSLAERIARMRAEKEAQEREQASAASVEEAAPPPPTAPKMRPSAEEPTPVGTKGRRALTGAKGASGEAAAAAPPPAPPAEDELFAGPPPHEEEFAGPPPDEEEAVQEPTAEEEVFAGPPPEEEEFLQGPPAEEEILEGPPGEEEFAGPAPEEEALEGPPAEEELFAGPPSEEEFFSGPPAGEEPADAVEQEGEFFGAPVEEEPVAEPVAEEELFAGAPDEEPAPVEEPAFEGMAEELEPSTDVEAGFEEPETLSEPEPEPEPEFEPEPVAVEPEPEPEPEPVAEEPVLEEPLEPEPVAEEPEPEAQPEPEPEAQPEPVAQEPEPEPVAVETEPEREPEPVAVEPEPEPVAEVPEPVVESPPSALRSLSVESEFPEALVAEARRMREKLAGADVTSSIGAYRRALEESPENLVLRTDLADIHLRYGLLDDAVMQYRQIINRKPESVALRHRLIHAHLWNAEYEDAAGALMEVAELHIQQGQEADALDSLQTVLSLDPHHFVARRRLVDRFTALDQKNLAAHHLRQLGDTALAKGSTQEAIDAYQQLMTLSDDPSFQERLAAIFESQGNTQKALEHYRALAQRYSAEEQWDEATAATEKLVALDPGNLDDRRALIELYRRLGRNEQVLTGQFALACRQQELGSLDEAIALLQAVLEMAPGHFDARRRLVDALLATGNLPAALEQSQVLTQHYLETRETEPAVELYLKLTGADPENVELRERLIKFYEMAERRDEVLEQLLVLADLHEKAARYKDAVSVLQRALEIAPTRDDLHYRVAQLYSDRLDNVPGALGELRRVHDLNPGHADAMDRYGRMLMADNRAKEAAEVLRDLVKANASAGAASRDAILKEYNARIDSEPTDWPTRFVFAELCFHLKMFQEAIKHFQKTVQISEHELPSYNMLGQAFVEDRRFGLDMAVRQFRKGLETKGHAAQDYLELRYNLAMLLYRNGRLHEAVTELKQIIAVDMAFKDAYELQKLIEQEIADPKVTRLRPPGA